MEKQKVSRNGMIDIMKLYFTLMVMFFHTGKFFKGGYIAVDFFFIVSGYLMAHSMEKYKSASLPQNCGGSDAVLFVLHKAKGLFPSYLAAWMLSFSITNFCKGSSLLCALKTLVRSPYNIFMIEMIGNYDMGHRVQASWYISAMLLSILIIYPIRNKHINLFDYYISPLIFFLFIGTAYQQKTGVAGFTVGYLTEWHI